MTVKAYAKINLTLNILAKREDGFHGLSSVMQTVSLCDIIRLEKGNEVLVACDCPDIDPGKNIAFAAANAFFEETGIKGGAYIDIEKNIPLAAGLGGGSADAAAVLNGLNDLYSAGLDYHKLRCIAEKIGADVPFCIEGGLALCEGKGEKITQLDPMPITAVVIVTEGVKPSTGEMYAELDRRGCASFKSDEAMLSAANIWEIGERLSNDFMPLWEGTPAENNIAIMKEFGAVGASLTGSGPSVFGLFEDWQAAQDCHDAFCRRGVESHLCSTTR